MKVLCLCLGNICRSPTAEGVLRARARTAGLDWQIDSAGTGAWHLGEAPDPRARAAARARGYDLSGQRARQVTARDFTVFDVILAMDAANLHDARARAPRGATARLMRYLDAAGMEREGDRGNVPDPWYSGDFDGVLDLIERAADRIVLRLDQPRAQRASATSPQAR